MTRTQADFNLRILGIAIQVIGYIIMSMLFSCSNTTGRAFYSIGNQDGEIIEMPLIDWNIYGSFTNDDSLLSDSFLINPYHYLSSFQTDTIRQLMYCGLYHPLYNQLDLKEVYSILPNDSSGTLKNRITYLHCEISSKADRQVYVEVKTSMDYKLFLNSDTLHRRDIQGLNIYPFRLRKGLNQFIVKAKCTGDDYSFESTIYDSISIARVYTDGQSSNIIYPQIDSSTNIVTLTNAHQSVLNTPVTLKFYDVNGMSIGKKLILDSDSFEYYVDNMRNNVSYICEMTLSGHTVRQPILCGNGDQAYTRFANLRKSLPDNHPRSAEIDQLLYRLDFLLHHPSRHDGDWWWQFKIPPLTYQLEHIFAHLGRFYGDDDTEANVLFITYRSEIDDSLQRYLLARPNKIDHSVPMPLVVIIRPYIENPHSFFSSPQLARQWAVNQMQALANKYSFLIMMPEMRTNLCGNLTPVAEQELKLAIKDVQEHYPVDTSRIFLHANCSGGYRALQMATDYPEMFKAIALYAPLYNRSITEMCSDEYRQKLPIGKLKRTPIFIHGDPLDGHSPYYMYKDLIDDCHKYNIPLTLSFKRNSGKFYNVVLVGEEAIGYFNMLNTDNC